MKLKNEKERNEFLTDYRNEKNGWYLWKQDEELQRRWWRRDFENCFFVAEENLRTTTWPKRAETWWIVSWFIIDDPSVGITGVSDDYEIAIMFDDRDVNESSRIVPTTEWIPAQLWGKYFVGKNNGSITHDSSGVPISSGNYNAWDESGNPSCGGYYSILNQPYTQFAVFVNKE